MPSRVFREYVGVALPEVGNGGGEHVGGGVDGGRLVRFGGGDILVVGSFLCRFCASSGIDSSFGLHRRVLCDGGLVLDAMPLTLQEGYLSQNEVGLIRIELQQRVDTAR